MSRLKLFGAAAISSILLVLGLAAPAQAVTIGNAACSTSANYKSYWLKEGRAYWTYNNGGRITNFSWELGTAGDAGRRSNNVNIKVWEEGRLIWARNSPDNLPYGIGTASAWTTVNIAVRHGVTWKVVQFEAIFDIKDADDPRCFASFGFY